MSAVAFTRTLVTLIALVVLPVLIVGVINRTKALWGGRRGLPILQLAFDLRRLVRKQPVYSSVTTAVFRLGPYVVLATALVSGLVAPVLGGRGVLSFPFDFVWFAYVWGLGRVALMLGALDTGSAFEGMGASREATYAALLEPVLFVVAGALCIATQHTSFAGALALRPESGATLFVWLGAVVALFVIVQVESARMPVDDPTTHLELTMIHEVMILDHSGPELAALQLGAAMKMTVGLSVLAALMNPVAEVDSVAGVLLAGAANAGLCLALAVLIGTVESLVARLKLNTIPQYILLCLIAASVALLATSWHGSGG
jgi:formate hydrogenlyase subunit 4